MATPAAQDSRSIEEIPGFDTTPQSSAETADALDKAFESATGEKPAGEVETAPVAPPAPKVEPKVEPKTETKVEPKVEPKTETKVEPKVEATPAPKVEAKADEFDSVELPPYTKPKTAESFAALKTLARNKVIAVEKERDDLKKQNEELSVKAANSGKIPEEVEKELKELRTFRAKLDIEADPSFKEFDTQVTANIDSIYSRLKAAGWTEDAIKKIQDIGGPAEVDWEKLSASMPAALKRFVDAKLVENETLSDKKTRAVEDAKKNADEYLKNRAEEATKSKTISEETVAKVIDENVKALGWLHELTAKENASDADKRAVELHNKLVAESKAFLADARKDDSPDFRAVLSLGYIQLLKLRQDYAALKSESAAKLAESEEKLKEATSLLERVKNSSTTRLREAPQKEEGSAVKVDHNTHGADALDAHLKAITGQ